MTTHFSTLIDKTFTMLGRWRGQRAIMLELTRSHASLRIILGGDDYLTTNLVIACIGPIYICGPTQWKDAAIEIQTITLDSGREGVVIQDEANGVRIVAESVEVRENVKLQNAPPRL